jgi:CubicO group peptidase (beta-lactamase class C family)
LENSAVFCGTFILSINGKNSFSNPDELDSAIEKFMKRSHTAGLSASIITKNGIIWSKGYGWADIENQILMTPDTVQNIGSISKTITATAVMQLWEKGLFKLDDDVNKYLSFKVRNPRFPEEKITFRQLLTHRSSIKDGPSYDESYLPGDPKISLETWIKEYFNPDGRYYDKEENFHKWKPGETGKIPKQPRAYTKVGFGLLGYLVETVSGTSFSDYTKKHIFKPLDMNQTSWYLKDLEGIPQARPYEYIPKKYVDHPEVKKLNSMLGLHKDRPVKEGYLPLSFYSFPNISDGLLRTSVHQLSRFLMTYMNEGRYKDYTILKEVTIRSMLSDNHFGRGLCWYKTKIKEVGTLWGHDGGDPGISTEMGFRKSDNTGVIIFTTSGGYVGRLLQLLYEKAEKEL